MTPTDKELSEALESYDDTKDDGTISHKYGSILATAYQAAIAERDEFQNMLGEKFPTSFGKLSWACGHTGPGKCAAHWDELEARAEAAEASLEALREQWDRERSRVNELVAENGAVRKDLAQMAQNCEKANMELAEAVPWEILNNHGKHWEAIADALGIPCLGGVDCDPNTALSNASLCVEKIAALQARIAELETCAKTYCAPSIEEYARRLEAQIAELLKKP